MTASWKLESTGGRRDAELCFCSGPSARPPTYAEFTVTIGAQSRQFTYVADADAWAAAQGVTRWRVAERHRGIPLAARIPIDFDEALERSLLVQVVERFIGGESLRDLAVEFSVEPGQLRAWLLGADPTNPGLGGLRPKRQR